jgi:deoxycytidine triphosphate deaminase
MRKSAVRLLKDDEIVAYVTGANSIVTGLPQSGDWYTVDSPVQPSSIDLHIGNIFLPDTTESDPGGRLDPLSGHTLKSGQTAVVTTFEELIIPSNMAGIGFPPSHVSFKGILMTNPGHVDPGYRGHMHFAVINMGRKDYVLKRGDAIVTLLLVELSGPAHSDWLQRHGGVTQEPPLQENLGRLSPDFVDMRKSSTEIAETVVKNAEFRVKLHQVWIPVVGALLAGLLGLFLTWVEPARKELQKVQTELAELKAKAGVEELKARVNRLEEERKQNPVTGASPQGRQP